MHPATLSAELREASPEIARRLAAILTLLAALVAHALLRDPRHVAHIRPLWTGLTRARARFSRLMARLAAGAVLGVPCRARPDPRSGAHSPPALPLPRRHGWLVAAIGWRAAGHGSQLNCLLAEAHAAAIIAQSPQAARILRPICRMLGLRPACLAPAPKPTPPSGEPMARAQAPRQPRSRPPQQERAGGWAPPAPETLSTPTPFCERLRQRWPWVLLPAKNPA